MAPSNTSETETRGDVEKPGPGARLRAAREALEVSTREVADALNLPIHVIEALEDDDFERLPPTVFTRGYLRSYARLLELSPEEVVASYPAPATDTETMEQVPAPEPAARSRLVQLGAIAAGLVLVVLVGLWLIGGSDETAPGGSPPAVDAPVVDREPGTPAPRAEPVGEPVVDRSADVGVEAPDAGAVRPGPEDDAEPVAVPAAEPVRSVPAAQPEVDVVAAPVDDRPVSESAAAESAAAPSTPEGPALERPASGGPAPAEQPAARPRSSVDEDGVRRITEFGDDLLEFSFIDECWVEIKSEDGANLYSDLNRAGSTLTLRGQGPFRVLLGYAPGVVLDYNGERVALASYTRNNVASLVVGR